MTDRPTETETWGSRGPYEQYVGRWSRKVAKEFLAWLNVPPDHAWADVGCGTGVLVEAILARFDPKSITAIDRSESFIGDARRRIADSRVYFEIGDATLLPWSSGLFIFFGFRSEQLGFIPLSSLLCDDFSSRSSFIPLTPALSFTNVGA